MSKWTTNNSNSNNNNNNNRTMSERGERERAKLMYKLTRKQAHKRKETNERKNGRNIGAFIDNTLTNRFIRRQKEEEEEAKVGDRVTFKKIWFYFESIRFE